MSSIHIQKKQQQQGPKKKAQKDAIKKDGRKATKSHAGTHRIDPQEDRR
jgi:hypothetical protein